MGEEEGREGGGGKSIPFFICPNDFFSHNPFSTSLFLLIDFFPLPRNYHYDLTKKKLFLLILILTCVQFRCFAVKTIKL